jgi:dipeptidyl aminopeptidase/acylaminoacyl peptidase
VDSGSSNVQYANGRLLFLRGTTLVAQTFDLKQLAVTGSPVSVVDRVLRHGVIPGSGLFSASQNGVLAYQLGTEEPTGTRLTWVDRQGHTLGTIGERVDYRAIALSHDEARVAAVVGKPPALFIVNLSNGVRRQFTFDPERGSFPVWSPDDRFIDFSAPSNGVPISAYRKPSNGAGASELVFPHGKTISLPFDRSRDGSLLYGSPTKGQDLWVVPSSGDRTPFRLAATSDDKRIAKFSPDGRWVAYVSNDLSGQSVWVVPHLGRTGTGDVKWRVSTGDGGTLPYWSADGRELFYISSSNMLTAVQVNGNGQAFEVGPSKALFPMGVSHLEGGYAGWTYAVSKDGRRFLVILSGEASSNAAREPVSIEVNWAAGLGR